MIGVIKEADADFVCLQEVTQDTKDMILKSETIKQNYLVGGGTYSGNVFIVQYGLLIISKYPCLFYEKHFPTSKMGRSLLCAEPLIPQNLVVATTHLESLGFSAPIRREQLKSSFDLIGLVS